MLDSVLYARDKYLKATGLMVPSYTTLLLSPLCSSELLNSNVNFWNDIYGFKMSAMKTGIYEDAMTNYMSPQDLASDKPAIFAVFDLHEVKVEDLSFRKPFEVEITKDLDEDSSGTVAPPEGKAEVEAEVGAVGEVHNITTTGLPSPSIHGFVLWFDTFFTTSRNIKLSHTDRAETWSQKAAGNGVGISFTTGPFKHHTHWKQGVLLVDQDEDQKWREKVTKAIAAKSRDGKQLNLTGLKKGDKVKGYITYRKREENSRELEIEVEWEEVRAGATEAAGDFVRGSNMRRQMWYMR